ncbi:MAG: RNA methyltransferase [Bacteroidales bacterium]|jgi:TrmH family RNA methyltransferase|nr:RNA methyltransferase [Bacteroidales bacterium]MDD4218288.1 RNA methyltransferase [Bacteroidales bacterium]MDY0142919.1 RNA methyltransferase [Bacteroidales bacterium]
MIEKLSKIKSKLISSLSLKKYRNENKLFVAEGIKILQEAVKTDCKIKFVVYNQDKELPIDSEHYEVFTTDDIGMKRISNLKSAPGVLTIMEIPDYKLDIEDLKSKLTMAVDDIQDPGNLGTMLRICDWFGIENLICSKNSADVYNPKVIQASMGAFLRVKIHYVDLPEFIENYKLTTAQKTYGTFLEGESIYKTKLSKDALFIMGNEGSGISDEITKFLDEKIFIPPYHTTEQHAESLNISVAAAIISSEFRRG